MKKFIWLPVLLAVGFGIIIVIGSTNPEDDKEKYDDYESTPSGVKYKDLVVGEGKEVKPGDTVKAHYTGWLKNGTKFDSSHDRGEPSTFSLSPMSPMGVIKGWQDGIPGMKVGGKRRLIIPPDVGYGKSGKPPTIPPDAQLTFEVEIVDVNPSR
jgi:FKBP-type peptidyl-prolyl cis-trans isomerase